MRKINLVVIHCSASDYPQHDNVETMRKWHLDRGWSDIGYHYFIRKEDGAVCEGRPIEKAGAHTEGKNRNSIGICLHGLKEEKFTEAQFDSCARLLRKLRVDHKLVFDIVPHRTLSKKSCPVFDMWEIYKRLY